MTAPMRQANELVERVARAIYARSPACILIPGAEASVIPWGQLAAEDKRELLDEARAAIDAIFLEDTPTLAARLISDFDTDESESPVDYRPGDYKPRVEVAKYVIGRIRGETAPTIEGE